VVRSGEPVSIKVSARFAEDHAAPMVGVMIRNRIGMDVFGTNTQLENLDLGFVAAGETIEVTLCLRLLARAAGVHDHCGYAIPRRIEPRLAR